VIAIKRLDRSSRYSVRWSDGATGKRQREVGTRVSIADDGDSIGVAFRVMRT
jgi:hypothetical protein